jgi:hypothetical protein
MFHRLVWMIEEEVTAELVSYGAFSSRVRYTYNGLEFDEVVMNDDFIPYDELGFEYEISEGSNEEV